MKKIVIDGKEYFQMELSDIEKLPKQNHSKDMLKDNNYDKCLYEIRLSFLPDHIE
jgi:hypothetical protein